mmetsp:Transcript_162649/g.521493  ORF Transcript_162649/g.521493 Transcript_162649/m.521493 type:complete len:325 (-) Transcript_162649:313-1287(-)
MQEFRSTNSRRRFSCCRQPGRNKSQPTECKRPQPPPRWRHSSHGPMWRATRCRRPGGSRQTRPRRLGSSPSCQSTAPSACAASRACRQRHARADGRRPPGGPSLGPGSVSARAPWRGPEARARLWRFPGRARRRAAPKSLRAPTASPGAAARILAKCGLRSTALQMALQHSRPRPPPDARPRPDARLRHQPHLAPEAQGQPLRPVHPQTCLCRARLPPSYSVVVRETQRKSPHSSQTPTLRGATPTQGLPGRAVCAPPQQLQHSHRQHLHPAAVVSSPPAAFSYASRRRLPTACRRNVLRQAAQAPSPHLPMRAPRSCLRRDRH